MLLRKIREKEKSVCVCVRKRLSLCLVIWYLWVAIWNSERGLLLFGFGSAVWWFALSWCVATFGFALWLSLWFVHSSHLIFGIRIWYLWTFGSLVCIWFFSFVFVRESYLGVFGIWICESVSTQIFIIPNLL